MFSGLRSARALGTREDQHNGGTGKMRSSHTGLPKQTRPVSNAARSGVGAPPRAIPKPATANRPQKRDFRGMFDSDSDGGGTHRQAARNQKAKLPAQNGKINASQKPVPKTSSLDRQQQPKAVARGVGRVPRQQLVRKQAAPIASQMSMRGPGSKGQALGDRRKLNTQSQGAKGVQSTMKLAGQPVNSQQRTQSGKSLGIRQGVINDGKAPGPKQLMGKRMQPRHLNGASPTVRTSQTRDPAKLNNRNEMKKIPVQGQPTKAALRGAYAGHKSASGHGGTEAIVQTRVPQNDSNRLAQTQFKCNRNGQNAAASQQSRPKQSQGLFSQVCLLHILMCMRAPQEVFNSQTG